METGLKEEVYAVSPQRAIGIAFVYTLNFWLRLARYIEDGRFFIDNNLIGNSIRPVPRAGKIISLPVHMKLRNKLPFHIHYARAAKITTSGHLPGYN